MQTTIQQTVSISGNGLHTGKQVTLTFHPADANSGICFRRTDLKEKPIIPALVDFVTDTSRGTTISVDGYRVMTIEHVMAAVSGMGIDNLLIDIDGEETPIMDGSALSFVKILQKANIQTLDAPKKHIHLPETIHYQSPDGKTEYTILPAEEFRISVMVDYDSEVVAPQYAELTSLSEFAEKIAPCRTFVFLHELEYLLKNNLIKGGDLSNAIVFVNKAVSQEELDRLAGLFNKPKVEVKSEGILNNLELYFQNEPARHKLLDVIGDLTLAGKPIKGHIIARRPGHAANVEFAKVIKNHFEKDQLNKAPVYDPNKKPLFNVNEVMHFLPHRPPFLLVAFPQRTCDARCAANRSHGSNRWCARVKYSP